MNQRETTWLRKIIFVALVILAVVSSVVSVRPVFAQATAANFDVVDDYISSKIKELGIPGAALVVVQGDQKEFLTLLQPCSPSTIVCQCKVEMSPVLQSRNVPSQKGSDYPYSLN